jgi:hypothetical protein
VERTNRPCVCAVLLVGTVALLACTQSRHARYMEEEHILGANGQERGMAAVSSAHIASILLLACPHGHPQSSRQTLCAERKRVAAIRVLCRGNNTRVGSCQVVDGAALDAIHDTSFCAFFQQLLRQACATGMGRGSPAAASRGYIHGGHCDELGERFLVQLGVLQQHRVERRLPQTDTPDT